MFLHTKLTHNEQTSLWHKNTKLLTDITSQEAFIEQNKPINDDNNNYFNTSREILANRNPNFQTK